RATTAGVSVEPAALGGAQAVGTETAVAAWARLLRGHAAMRRLVATELHADHELTINEYEALQMLAEADEQRLRGIDLAEGLKLTPSGVTRLLEGLRGLGLVEKGTCPSDARVTYAVLTEAGGEKLRAATCTHVRRVRALLEERYTQAELATLGDLLARLPGAGSSGDGCGVDAAQA
ncbi:MAG: MarR family winged helix-turn-helix transcriptional regulator, partial [Solirubrobacteraceae bacterium]